VARKRITARGGSTPYRAASSGSDSGNTSFFSISSFSRVIPAIWDHSRALGTAAPSSVSSRTDSGEVSSVFSK